MKSLFESILVTIIPILVVLAIGEGLLRLKNMSMDNYDIEMWRYSQELKRPSSDPALGHEHVPGTGATLQNIPIRINAAGMRGEEVRAERPARRIIFLGGSVVLGWGVPEADILSARLGRMLSEGGRDVEVLNAGIGNYNAERYVRLFLTRLAPLEPTDIVVGYFVRDAEVLTAGGGNWFLRNSQLAVMAWSWINRLSNNTTADAHYGRVYAADSPGLAAAKNALGELAAYARPRGIRLHMAMIPDMHDLPNYRLGFIHEIMKEVAADLGMTFTDMHPALADLKSEQIWAMPGDPHPNALGHERMAAALLPVLAENGR